MVGAVVILQCIYSNLSNNILPYFGLQYTAVGELKYPALVYNIHPNSQSTSKSPTVNTLMSCLLVLRADQLIQLITNFIY